MLNNLRMGLFFMFLRWLINLIPADDIRGIVFMRHLHRWSEFETVFVEKEE